MATLNKMRKRQAKSSMERLSMGGSLATDSETNTFMNQGQQAADAAIGAQQTLGNRAAMGNTAGAPVLAGALTAGTQKLGEASADAAVKISGAGQQFKQATHDARLNRTLTQVDKQIAQNREDIGYAIQAADVVGSMVANVALPGAGAVV